MICLHTEGELPGLACRECTCDSRFKGKKGEFVYIFPPPHTLTWCAGDTIPYPMILCIRLSGRVKYSGGIVNMLKIQGISLFAMFIFSNNSSQSTGPYMVFCPCIMQQKPASIRDFFSLPFLQLFPSTLRFLNKHTSLPSTLVHHTPPAYGSIF